jgi:hypothetical protein
MKTELITFVKTTIYVTLAVLLANAIERKYLKTKTAMPLESVKE